MGQLSAVAEAEMDRMVARRRDLRRAILSGGGGGCRERRGSYFFFYRTGVWCCPLK